MSYQVLARKWRPSNFSEVAGQAHVLKSLINALDNERLHHAYLFTGTRGVGKTTLARILAKCLNCEEGIRSKPCESCDSCREINEGRFIDLIEVDAASRTKVEDTRELLDNVQYAPSRGRFKVYLIDEVHMLSNHSFNALLKTLEEPPPHVKFLFATTDPQKLPITILSRCLQFNLKNLSPQLITEYLSTVLGKENIEFEEDALWQIASAASGSMRDALTLVDQAIAYCEGRVATDGVVEMLGVPPQKQVYALLKGMASRSVSSILELIHNISEQTPDYGHTLDNLLSTLHRIAIAQIDPKAVDNSYGDLPQIVELASLMSAEDVQLYYQMGIKGREDLRLSAEVRTAFEMLLIRMLVFSPNYIEPVESASDDVEATPTEESEIEKKKNKNEVGISKASEAAALDVSNEENQASQQKSAAQKDPLLAEDSSPVARVAEPADREVNGSEQAAPLNASLKTVSEKLPAPSIQPEQSVCTAVSLSSLDSETWLQLYPLLSITGIAANVLANSNISRVDENNIYFVLDRNQSAVYNDDLLPKLSQALSDYFSRDISVHIQIGDTQSETPALLSQRLKEERHASMVDEFEKDENVQELLKHFSGRIAIESIAPHKD